MTGKDLRIVFMGTPDFAVASLKKMIDQEYNIVGVVTTPDRPAGRGQQLTPSAVKQYALEKQLNILQPEKLKAPEFLEDLKALKPDLQVVVAFRMLPEQVWSLPPLGTFNLHGSLLPKYRGAAPLNWAIMNGDSETGVTTFLLKQEIDTGNILFQEKTRIRENDTVETIHDILMETGANLIIKTIEALASGEVNPISQDELIGQGYYPSPAPKIFKDDCLINWQQPGAGIRNLIRGLSPYPAAWTNLFHSVDSSHTTAKIFKADFESGQAIPGQIVSDLKQILKIGCYDGWLVIRELQLAGKKKMTVEEFLRGFKQIENYRTIL